MNKNFAFYICASVLLLTILVLFNSSYKTLNQYSSLIQRHHAVQVSFQQLGNKINNAAVLSPEMLAALGSSGAASLFFTNREEIIAQINFLLETVKDSINIAILKELHPLVHSELTWLLNSNVPDSILHNRSRAHINALAQIDSLINSGLARTAYLIGYRENQVAHAMKKVRTLIFLFVILSGILLIYTTATLFKQQSKRKSKELELETVLNRISDGVVSVDNNWRYTFLNDASMLTHPFEREKIIGKPIWEIHPELKGTIFWEKYHEAMQSRKTLEIEDYYAPMDIWFSVKIYPSANGLTIFYKNVTENKKANEKLSKTLKEIEDYKSALDVASIVAITDQKGIIRHANDNFCKISKYTREELIGKDHRLINSGYHSKEFIRNLWTSIANGKIWKGEMRNRAKDGSIYWVDTTIVPFLDDHGKPYQYVAIRADITRRKDTEEHLLKSEKIYKTIASSIPGSVICLLDRDYRYLLIEGDMLEKLGYSKNALLGNKAQDVLPVAVFDGIKDQFAAVLGGQMITRENSVNGFDIVSRFIPLRDADNEVYAIMTVAIDVTQLKHAQRDIIELNKGLEKKIAIRTDELRKSNEELESFSYSVSHDLRAPLRGITGFAAVLNEEYGPQLDAEANRIIHIIQQSAGKMGQLIDDLLAFSRTGKQPLHKTIVKVDRIIADIIQEIDKTPANAINWKIAELPTVNVDPATMRQVWANLLGNAAKYSSKNQAPQIQIGSYRQEDEWVFYVRDNGVGFDDKYKHKLFKVFQRLHDSGEFDGTGVGLALVERIISKHGGRIWAEGKTGEGACFSFSLPA